MMPDQIVELVYRLIDLGVVPDDDDRYEEFEELIIDLLNALEATEGNE